MERHTNDQLEASQTWPNFLVTCKKGPRRPACISKSHRADEMLIALTRIKQLHDHGILDCGGIRDPAAINPAAFLFHLLFHRLLLFLYPSRFIQTSILTRRSLIIHLPFRRHAFKRPGKNPQ